MKGRTKFFNYFIACIATLSLATFAACSDDDPETPSGKLVLTASASSFVAGEGKDISMRWMKRTVTIFWSLPPTSLKECQWILIGVRRGLV